MVKRKQEGPRFKIDKKLTEANFLKILVRSMPDAKPEERKECAAKLLAAIDPETFTRETFN